VVRFGLSSISRIEGRTEGEHRAVLALRNRSGHSPQVLVIGSSLLLHAVEFPKLQQDLAPEFKTVRYVIEQTAYFDWYYGMRALYAEGIRPDAVVFLMSASYTASNDIRGEYFAYRMMQTRDLLRVSRDVNLSATETFAFLVARWSAFYGTRSETRKVLLSYVVPSIKDLRPLMIPPPRPPAGRDRTVQVLAERMKQFDDLVREHGGRYIFLEAPDLNRQDAVFAREAGERAGVPVLVPLGPESLSKSDFLDGAHVNEGGAARYTTALLPLLRKTLEDLLRK
jgi:hypothetical protein